MDQNVHHTAEKLFIDKTKLPEESDSKLKMTFHDEVYLIASVFIKEPLYCILNRI